MIIHLSDLHYRSAQKDNIQADKFLRRISKEYPHENIVVTGDITEDGHLKQYKNAWEALKLFEDRLFVVPGNHDFGKKGNFYDKKRAARFDKTFGTTFKGINKAAVRQKDDVWFIGLDSNLETLNPFDFACGKIGKKQLDELDDIMKLDCTKVVYFHHHPFVRDNPFMELQDAKALMRLLYFRATIVLFGHKHEAKKWNDLNGIPLMLAAGKTQFQARRITKDLTIQDIL